MKRILRFVIFAVGMFLFVPTITQAQKPTNLKEARELAKQSHRLILIEFFRDD